MRIPVLLFTLGAVGCAGLALTACKKKKKMSQAEICKQGCQYRMACVNDLELEKSPDDAVREHLRRRQAKETTKFVRNCVEQCRAGHGLFRAQAACGVKAHNCDNYFTCESKGVAAWRQREKEKKGKR